ncbi:iron ABC transporter substrate-binding protein [Methanosarcina sp. Mfa9]|uniref:iron ABC transporter substrate-binding protein n=1 Tax=Methanosarcina sp. Mfa9 TaxID=3439063 RepID=UPI003F8670D8
MIKRSLVFWCAVMGVFCMLLSAGCVGLTGESGADTASPAEEYRTVVDSRGVEVKVPVEIERVVTVNDGFIEGVLTRLGEVDKVVGMGGQCCQKVYTYSFEDLSGNNYSYTDGMNPVLYLNPGLQDLPLVTEGNTGINYETLAGLNPDLVIIRLGASSFRAGSEENIEKTIETIDSLGIPLIILKGPPYQEKPDVNQIAEEIRIIGQVFGKEKEALDLAAYLDDSIAMIQERTQGIPEDQKPRVMQFGLSPRARDGGGAGMAWGLDTIESFFIEDLANAKNAYHGTGAFVTISTEQILALNPDVIVLPTAQGYHPASELYTAPYYQNLQELDAVKNRRVYALPWTPYNWAKRLEYPVEAMIIAKAAYPDRFSDIKVHEWVLEFYQNVYGVDPDTAKALRSAQWLDWMEEEGF